jgi:stearoyl-CoA desaturase (Delta-9 desaturase)
MYTQAISPPADAAPAEHTQTGSVPPISRIESLIAVVVPFLGLVAAIYFLWGRGFSWLQLGLFLGMYCVSILGVTIGFHRLFTHRSFQTFRPIQFILAIAGSMAVEGPLVKWVANHRRHHQMSDRDGDPHSPYEFGTGILGMLKGLWHAHAGWLFCADQPGLARYVPDLLTDRALMITSRLFGLWVALGLLIPALIGWLVTGSWMGALFGFIWGGLLRVFLVHHVTFSINSICHIWGGRPFRSHDHSANNLVFGILGMGEGWHNNHHAFPTSARHGLKWWQIDVTYLIIWAMSRLGLAWKVHVPSAEAMMAKRVTSP